MRYLVLCLFLGCVGSRSPNIDVDVSFAEPAASTPEPASTFEAVANVTGVSGFIDRKGDHVAAKQIYDHGAPALHEMANSLSRTAAKTLGYDVPTPVHSDPAPVSEPKPNPRVRVLFFTGRNCPPCITLKKDIADALEPKGWTIGNSPACDIQTVYVESCATDAQIGERYGIVEGHPIPVLIAVTPDGKELGRSGFCRASKLAEWITAWRDKIEQTSVLTNKPATVAKSPACQCSPCTCVNCACGLQMPAAINGGCSTCGVSYRRGWRR